MRTGDLRATAAIRNVAMRLFAERGLAGVSVRDVAAGAGVSPSLVIHHYGSKQGLKTAVDQRASEVVLDLLAPPEDVGDRGSMAARFVAALGEDSDLIAYVRRLLIDGGPEAAALFGALFEASAEGLSVLETAGVVRTAPDAPARVAFLLVNDLALLVLRDQIAEVLGVDPLSQAGMARWTEGVMDVYATGIYAVAVEPV